MTVDQMIQYTQDAMKSEGLQLSEEQEAFWRDMAERNERLQTTEEEKVP